MGFRTSDHEILALMHFWRYVGHLMGVRPKWFPKSKEEAYQLGYVTLVKSANRAGDDGRNLCQSYVEAFTPAKGQPWRRRLRDSLAHRLHLGFTRFFLPPWIYRANGLPRAGLWALHPLAVFPFLFAAETMRRHLPAVDELVDRLASAERERWFAYHMGERQAEYKAAEKFTR